MKYLIYSFFFLSILFSCKEENKVEQQSLQKVAGKTMGTFYSISYYGNQNLQEEIDSVLIAVNQSVSTYIPRSTISKVNQAEAEELVAVDEIFITNFLAAKQIYKQTKGAFNPAIMPLVNYYGFGFEKVNVNAEIDSVKVAQLLQLVDFNQFTLSGNNVVKTKAAAQLDFSALAKGFGVDEVGRFLERKAVDSYLINIGGELLAKGRKTNQKLWTGGIRKPSTSIADRKIVQHAVPLNNQAMATSGNYENYRELTNGKTIAHTINPKTGFPQQINAQILSSTVIAENCMLADGYATAFKVMGLNESKKILQTISNIQVFFIYLDKDGEIKTFSTLQED